ncbi:hypothetical protein [Pseudomonas sp. NFACC24-1]|uniref:hypothetical protein n=1 Tax=Pseudomonas sp. NFACC24-1 TaxID=1566189 RepID=UPI001C4768E7|nr:hypothetical protein [Pseudomonas sp. NFACC24-1]
MPSDFSGAYVRCYVSGVDYVDASQKALRRLSDDGLYPVEILQPILEMSSEDWSEHIKEQWPDHFESLPTQFEFEEVIQNNKVVYGPFGSYS